LIITNHNLMQEVLFTDSEQLIKLSNNEIVEYLKFVDLTKHHVEPAREGIERFG